MKRVTKMLVFLAVCILAIGMSAMAHSAPEGRLIKLSVGKADTINLDKPVADVLVANPAVADVGSLRANRLFVIGKAIGDTNILVFDDAGNQLASIAIQVRADQQTLRDTVREFFPQESVDVRTVNDSIVLQGEVSTPAVANQVRDLVGRFVKTQGQTLVDLMKVRGEQQVMLKVKVIEANRTVLREYGIQGGLGGRTATNGVSPGVTAGNLSGGLLSAENGFNASTFTGAVGLAAVSEFGGGTIALAKAGNFGPLTADFEGLENRGLVNTLAEPTLTAISGETAGFLAGGEFPVPATRDTSGNITVEFKQFGVALNFIPTVMANDRISLQLSSEVSERSDADGVTFGGITVPGITIRRAQTTVQMGSGGTLMIAGLLKSNTIDSRNGFPGLQDLPILGNLFKSKSFQRGESELVFLVTPYVVEPYAQPQAERIAAASPSPSEIVTTGHAVSLSDLHAHIGGPVPASAAVPTAVPSATPAGVPAPVPGVVPGMPLQPLPVRRSDATPASPDTAVAQSAHVNVIWDAPASKPKVAAVKHVKAVHKTAVAAAPKEVSPAPVKQETAAKAAETSPKTAESKPAATTDSLGTAEKKAAVPASAPVLAPVKLIAPATTTAPAKPDKAAAADVPKPDKKTAKAADPLAQTFMNNIKNTYGNKAPSAVTGAGVGYIVD